MNLRALLGIVIATSIGLPQVAMGDERSAQVQAHIDTFAKLLETRPEMVVDLSTKSGEYCMNTWKFGGDYMTHHAIDPSTTSEDVIDFVKADSMEGALDFDKLPRMPDALGAMQPNTWYYLPAGEYEPHHETKFPFALLIRATNIE